MMDAPREPFPALMRELVLLVDLDGTAGVAPLRAGDEVDANRRIRRGLFAVENLARVGTGPATGYPSKPCIDTGPTGLNAMSYNGARWYRGRWGRYTQGDPLHLGGGTHLFAYANSRPLNYADPLGFTMWLGPPSLKDRVSKGIVYSPRPPAPIYDSPDWDNVRPPEPIYARIKPDWYVFWDGG